MSKKIVALYDLKNNIWDFNLEENPNHSLCIGFFEEGKTSIVFDNLSFGFSICDDSKLILEKTYPKSEESYIETSERYILEYNLDLECGFKYKLKVWAKNSDVFAEDFYDLTADLPPQPYPSWMWKNGNWSSPIEHPNDGLVYHWSETDKKWVIDPNVPVAGTHYLNLETNEWILVPQYELY